jgi:hypothetical protein
MRATTQDVDDDRLRQSADMCARRGWEPVSFVREEPGKTAGLADALRMVRDGVADRIVMLSAAELPDVLESDTGSLPGQQVMELIYGSARRTARRRIRPTQRGGGAA